MPQCDLTDPGCAKCAKAGWECPGYRNAIDLLFHDETSKIAGRVKVTKDAPEGERVYPDKAKTRRELCKSRKSPEQIAADANLGLLPALAPPEAGLHPGLDELAIGFFSHHYVHGPMSTRDTWTALEKYPCLLASIVALGAAGVTQSGLGSSYSRQVELRYSNAIHLTNEALRSPREVKKDSTLLAVNLLGLFETTTGSRKAFDPWHNHIAGATALLQYRGAAQFESAEGGRLFTQTTIMLVTSCIRRRIPIPAHIHVLMAEAEKHVPDPADMGWLSLRLALRFADLYAKLLPNNMPRSPEDAECVIREALALDLDALNLLESCPDDCRPVKIRADGPTVFAGYVHAFRFLYAAQQYNSTLWRRIILQDVMLKALRSHPNPDSLGLSDVALQYIHNASDTIYQIQLEILASVPQHFENSCPHLDFVSLSSTTVADVWPKDRTWTNFSYKDLNPWRLKGNQNPDLPAVRTNGGLTIQWPLYIAGAADAVGGKVRTWVINTLRLIGKDMRLHQATLLADSLEACEGEQSNVHVEFANGGGRLRN